MRALQLGLIFVLASATAGFADDQCPPLTMVTSVDMTIGKDGRPYVPVKINGVPKQMLVDTGGFFTEVTQATVDELHMQTRHVNLEMIGVAGDTTNLATTGSLAMGNLSADNTDFMIMGGAHEVGEAAGIFAPNFLRPYDVDFDFGAKKFNLISQKHCDGKVIYWPADVVAVVPIRISPDGHIQLTVTLDGQPMNAMLDTGSTETFGPVDTLSSEFGLHLGAADTPIVGGNDGTGPAIYTHRFKSLALEGISVANPQIVLVSDMMKHHLYDPSDAMEGDTRIKDPHRETGLSDITLGMNILHRFHLYIAYKEKKLYITPATAPAPSAPASPAVATTSGGAAH